MFLNFIQIGRYVGTHLYITILVGLNQPTAFAANLLQCRGGSRNPTSFKMKLFATIAMAKNFVNNHREVLHLSYDRIHGSVCDN